MLIEVPFRDTDGNEIPPPNYDFEIEYFVGSGIKKVVASKKGDVFTNCSIIDGLLTCTFDKPRLGRGRLMSRKTYHIPDPRFPDAEYTIVTETTLDTTIV